MMNQLIEWFNQSLSKPIPVLRQITLQRGDVLEIPQDCLQMRVLSGTAWIVIDRRDIVVSKGGEITLPQSRCCKALCGLGNTPLTLELQRQIPTHSFPSLLTQNMN